MAANAQSRAPSVRPPPPPATDGEYTAKNISALKDAEHVRLRAAMYIGDTAKAGYHHLLWEIVDNCIDEAINGYARKIEVILDADGKGATVVDDGRGIPVDIHPEAKKPALELDVDGDAAAVVREDRKSTRLNSSHSSISYAV